MPENKFEIVFSSFDLVNYTSCNAIQRAEEVIRYVSYKISVTSQDWRRVTLYSLPNQLFERACKMSTNQDIFPTQHNTPAFSFAFIQPDLWAGLWDTCFAWEVKFIVKIHARIQGFFKWVSPKHFSRLLLPPKQIETPGPHLVQWPPLRFKFGNHSRTDRP